MKSLITFVTLALLSVCLGAQASLVTIDATTSGCNGGPNGQACSNGPTNMFSGATVNLINPVKLTLDPGIYSITNGDLSGTYSAWRFNSGANWAWNFGIATDNGNGTGNVFFSGWSAGVYSNQAAMASSNGANYGGPNGPTAPQLSPSGGPGQYYAMFTLSEKTTLAFFILDYYLPDNAGGVMLNINSITTVPVPAAVWLFSSALVGIGIFGKRRETT
ncbi:hypothetical protein ACH518_18645 [Methylomonas sp. HW2-6]|uniref:hypothetical protein n=1 Tax=Methylomonas sp. HW2-6 TaxID=3376687 RepID=UPI004042CE8F